MAELILIVDDEADLVGPLEFAFRREGFRTASAGTGAEALRRAAADPRPDLVLLDLMLPDMPGTEVFRRLRASPEGAAVPVIMLTARGEEIDRIIGFEMGADDYVVKPFSTRELVLRVRAVLRRVGAGGPAEAAGRLRRGPLELDLAGHRAWVAGEEVALTALEFRLLRTLAQRRGRVQSRERLLEDVWEMAPTVTTRTVDAHVRRLRKKLGPAADLIETVRGVGYRFADDPGGR